MEVEAGIQSLNAEHHAPLCEMTLMKIHTMF